MKINRINPPSWARPFRVVKNGIPGDAAIRLDDARDALLSAVDAEVSAYLADPQLVFDSADEFPSKRKLTGDYYIGDLRYDLDPQTGTYRVAVMARCLAHLQLAHSQADDYLGLEVWLAFDTEQHRFSVCRNTDSSAI